MFVLTAKLSKPRLIAAAVALLAIVVLLVSLLGGGTQTPETPAVSGATNDERVAFLATYGWSVNAEPVKTQRVKIPTVADSRVFSRYNELQQSQGFDLTGYAGKEVSRFVYEILNYPDASEPVYATLLVSDGSIIGGDVTNSAPNGLIHGFKKPSTQPSQSETPSTGASEESGEATEPSEA